MLISKKKLESLAKMAFLELPKDEEKLKELQGDISNIIHFTQMVKQTTTASQANSMYDQKCEQDLEAKTKNSRLEPVLRLRKDVITEGGNPENILRNAKITQSGYFVSQTKI